MIEILTGYKIYEAPYLKNAIIIVPIANDNIFYLYNVEEGNLYKFEKPKYEFRPTRIKDTNMYGIKDYEIYNSNFQTLSD